MKVKGDIHIDTYGHIIAEGHVHAIVLKPYPLPTDEHLIHTPRGAINATFVPCGYNSGSDVQWTTGDLTCPDCIAAVHLPRNTRPWEKVYCPTCFPGAEADQFAERVARRQAWEAKRGERDARATLLENILLPQQRIEAHSDDRDEWQRLRDEALREALAQGIKVDQIARYTGLTPARIYQIRDGRR